MNQLSSEIQKEKVHVSTPELGLVLLGLLKYILSLYPLLPLDLTSHAFALGGNLGGSSQS